MSRVEENSWMVDKLDYYGDRMTVDDKMAMILRDISKSLAVIADKMTEEKDDQLS